LKRNKPDEDRRTPTDRIPNETRHELRSLDGDKLTVIVRSMRHEMDGTAVTLVKIERRLDPP
jgi:hypothetical protein